MDDSSTRPTNSASTRKGRQATKLKNVALKRQSGQKLEFEFDMRTCAPIGNNAAKFKSYVEETFTVPNDSKLKHVWISYAGEQWKAFKADLTRRYIFGDCDPAYEKYPFILQDEWVRFVESRNAPEFQVKRQKARECQAKNLYPHTLSRMGYKGLKKDIKLKANIDGSIENPPSPPRHELWKLARKKKSREYTSEPTTSVAEKIDSLVEQSTQGTFVPLGCQDILTTAIGTPEHPGRVRTAGRGVGLRMYYGPHSRHGPTPSLNEGLLDDMREKLRADLRAELVPQIREQMRSEMVGIMAEMGYSQQKLDVDARSPKATVYVSIKGSCAAPSIEEWSQGQSQLKPVELLGAKLVEFRGESTTLILEHDNELPFFSSTQRI